MSEFLTRLAGAAMSGTGGQSGGGLGGILGHLMGGGAPQGGMAPQPPTLGGFGGLLNQLRGGGLGPQVDSWVGNGQNQPVSPQQLEGALGGYNLDGMAQSAGTDRAGLLGMLSQALPHAVNGMTPGGRMPQSEAELPPGGMGGMLGNLFGGGASAAGGGGYGMQQNAAFDTGGGAGGDNYSRKMASLAGDQGGGGDGYGQKPGSMGGGQKG